MSLSRRWLDPLRSRWWKRRRVRSPRLSTRNGLSLHLRLDDPYSYLVVQLVEQVNDLLVEKLKPLKLVLHTSPAGRDGPVWMSAEDWHQYVLKDAETLARQHRFIFQANAGFPDTAQMQQALDILRYTALTGEDYLHLLQNLFHMVWQHQQGKLATLHQMALKRAMSEGKSRDFASQIIQFSEAPLPSAYWQFGGRRYQGIDDVLRLSRRLKKQRLLTAEPVLLINHIEWGEHLVSDPLLLADIQARHAELEMYVALEDPLSWLLLDYLQREMLEYYNIRLNVFPVSYQGRDRFDWELMMRLSRRIGVPFAPFCRPGPNSVFLMASALASRNPEEIGARLLTLLKPIWTRGRDVEFLPHQQELICKEEMAAAETTTEWLLENDRRWQALGVPELPAFRLQVEAQTVHFGGLYRLWMLEAHLSDRLAQP